MIRVAVADDHLIVREGLRLMLETAEDILLVGDAVDGAEAIRLVEDLQPDVILMDVRMPGLDGIATIARIRAICPHVAAVILTTYDEGDLMIRGLQAGACGFLLKDATLETLLDSIRAAARGDVLLKPATLARLLARSATGPRCAGDRELTERELAVLAGAARGERSKEIARNLGISERTVRAHLTSIYTKLEVDSRAAAVALALRAGILPASPR